MEVAKARLGATVQQPHLDVVMLEFSDASARVCTEKRVHTRSENLQMHLDATRLEFSDAPGRIFRQSVCKTRFEASFQMHLGAFSIMIALRRAAYTFSAAFRRSFVMSRVCMGWSFVFQTHLHFI